MILADTSAWVEYDRATGSRVDERVAELIASDGPIAVTEPIAMEVLAGARDDTRATDLRRLLASVRLIPIEPAADFEGAAILYRRCRSEGVTPRGMIDCLIAAVALRSGAALLCRDTDFALMAVTVGIDLDPASSE